MSNATYNRGRFRLRLPALSGGLDLAAEPDAIDDRRLSEGMNLWWERGALRTRPGVYCEEGRCETLFTPVEGVENTYTFGGVEPVGPAVDAGDIPAQVVTEAWSEYGVGYVRPLRIGRDGQAYPYRDEDGRLMKPFAADHCLVTNDESGNPLFFTPDGVFLIGGESIDGAWMSMEDWLYVPLLRVGGTGASTARDTTLTGVAFEAANLLTPRFRAQYTTDNVGIYYFLPRQGLDNEAVTAELLDDFGEAHYYRIEADKTQSAEEWGYCLNVSRSGGYVWFSASSGDPTAVAATGHGGNLTIEASKTDEAGRQKVLGMRFGTWFGGDSGGLAGGTRLFLAGNPRYPHLIHWSDVNNALYFPTTNYAYVGDATQAITAFGRQEDALIIFKERELYAAGYESTTVTAAEVTAGSVGDVTAVSAAFPLTPLSAGVGCDLPATIRLCHDRLVWADREGRVHMLLAQSPYSGRNVRTLSATIAPGLRALSETEWENASAAVLDGWYLLLTGNTVWVLHYDSPAFVRYAGRSTDAAAGELLCWFRWDVTVPGVTWQCVVSREAQAVLYGLQEQDGELRRLLYTFSGEEDRIPEGTSFVTQPISFSAATRCMDAGEEAVRKDITGVRLDHKAATHTRLMVTLTDDEGGVWRSPYMTAPRGCRLLSGLRQVRKVRLRLNGQGTLAVTGITLTGNGTGEVR